MRSFPRRYSHSSLNSSDPEIFIVGLRWSQHSKHSGYEGFLKHIGIQLKPPVDSRWPWANNAMQRIVPRPKYIFSELLSWLLTKISGRTYSLPILRIELAAARHMFGRTSAIYHVIYGETDFWFLGRIANLTGNFLVVSFHDGAKVLSAHGIDRKLLSQVSAIFILGESQREYFENRFPSDRIFVIPHGVDSEFFIPNANITRERMVLTVGGHTRDFKTYARAINLNWERDPSIRFVAVSTQIGHLGEPFELPGVEYLTGISDTELLNLYQQCSVVAFAFEWAIANNSVLEAMACAAPIVATNIGGVREYLPDGAGMLVPPNNDREFADAIYHLLNNQDKALEIGLSARRFSESLDYEVVAQKMRSTYREIFNKGNVK